MQHRVTRAFAAAGFSIVFALTAACGGAAPEAKAPGTEGADAPRVGSTAPEPASDSTPAIGADAPRPTVAANSSTDNGSDIIPPFTNSKELTKKPASVKGSKKSGKPKKKG